MALRRSILITGCSKGGLGEALARAMHQRGHRVIASGRSEAKLAHFKGSGIDTVLMDVQSPESISSCVTAVTEKTGGSLDMLVNNSGTGYSMPLTDVDLDTARQVFEVNVWSLITVSQAFLPLLLKAAAGGQAVIANNTSVASLLPMPTQGIYNTSKAAAAMLTDTLRLELAMFNIRVVELKTGSVKTGFFDNRIGGGRNPTLPPTSIYAPAKAQVEQILTGKVLEEGRMEKKDWANQVADALLKPSPPAHIWKGGQAKLLWYLLTFAPAWLMEKILVGQAGLPGIAKAIQGK